MAGLLGTLLGYPGSPLHRALPNPLVRRAIMGALMGGTAIAVIYSPLGARSGAHLNPATTLTFLRLGKIAPWDALFYGVAQFAGGYLGVGLLQLLIGHAFVDPPVAAVATRPGPHGALVAFAAELVMAFILMLLVLIFMSHRRIAARTGLLVGVLVALYIL